MRELVLIIPDLYLQEGEWPALLAPLPGLEALLRFATREALPQGWRAWLCRTLGRDDLAALAPASLAAGSQAAHDAPSRRLWLAEPVHLQAGLTRVQLAPEGLLRLGQDEAAILAADFRAIFGASGLALQPLPAGNFILHGLEAEARTEDPARYLGSDIAEALPAGSMAAALRRLSGEVELWLHSHPVNRARASRGVPAVSSLWIWGGGDARGRTVARSLPAGFGEDASLVGLWRLCGQEPMALPGSLAALDDRSGSSAVAAIGGGSSGAGLEALERDWFAPAAMRLARGELAMLTLVANDLAFRVRSRDRLRFWRRRRRWIEHLR